MKLVKHILLTVIIGLSYCGTSLNADETNKEEKSSFFTRIKKYCTRHKGMLLTTGIATAFVALLLIRKNKQHKDNPPKDSFSNEHEKHEHNLSELEKKIANSVIVSREDLLQLHALQKEADQERAWVLTPEQQAHSTPMDTFLLVQRIGKCTTDILAKRFAWENNNPTSPYATQAPMMPVHDPINARNSTPPSPIVLQHKAAIKNLSDRISAFEIKSTEDLRQLDLLQNELEQERAWAFDAVQQQLATPSLVEYLYGCNECIENKKRSWHEKLKSDLEHAEKIRKLNEETNKKLKKIDEGRAAILINEQISYLKTALDTQVYQVDVLIALPDTPQASDTIKLIETNIANLNESVKQCGNPQELVQQIASICEKLDIYKKYLTTDVYQLCKEIYVLQEKRMDLSKVEKTLHYLNELKKKVAQEKENIMQATLMDTRNNGYNELLTQKLTLTEKILKNCLAVFACVRL